MISTYLVCFTLIALQGGGEGRKLISRPGPYLTPLSPARPVALSEAAKFAGQATLGADRALLEKIAAKGFEAWIDDQMAMPASLHLPIVEDLFPEAVNPNDPEDPFIFPPRYLRSFAFWQNAIAAPDVLRQRIALALSEILVVSDSSGELADAPRGMADYYDLLVKHAFGDYRQLLFEASIHPVMGYWLSHLDNQKSDPVLGTFPDENYAREVMQLFSIGLVQLNSDGTPRVDASGRPIPTYSNADITEMARIFTGLVAAEEPESEEENFEPFVVTKPMVMDQERHDTGAKSLLDGLNVPAGQDGMDDIRQATDFLADHPNTAPFLAFRLIQRLVTSNPSPAYVQRAAEAFRAAGGNLGTLIKAILLDPEARRTNKRPSFGRLQEPMVRYIRFLRAIGVESPDGTFYNDPEWAEAIRQHPLSAPSVFNFFQPDFSPNNSVGRAGLLGPEFQIINANTITGFADLIGLIVEEDVPISSEIQSETYLALDDELELIETGGIDALLDELALTLADGRLSKTTRAVIRDEVRRLEREFEDEVLDEDLEYVLLAVSLYLVMIAPETVVAN